jgi:hypothetical protein
MATRTRTTGPPDFVGVGAQRCGTTWWFRILIDHPAIRRARRRRKELHFFDRFSAREMQGADIERYHRLFPRSAGQIAGEWTPRYMRDVWTPRLLHRAAPDAKLLVLLRDPVERLRSGVLHQLTKTPGGRPELLAADAVERGRYASQLRRLREFYDEDSILVLQFEKCRLDPIGQYQRTLRFLDVADDHVPHEIERPRGTTTEPNKEPLWPDLKQALRTALQPEVERLRELVPDLDIDLWPNFAHLAAQQQRHEKARPKSEVS